MEFKIGPFVLVCLLLMLGICDGSKFKDCAGSVNAIIVVDGTVNINPEQQDLMVGEITSITEGLPDKSIGSVTFVSDTSEHIETFKTPIPNSTEFKLKIKSKVQGHVFKGQKINSSALEEAVKKRTTVNLFKKKAEIVYLVFNDTTKVENIPEILWTKKTFAVSLGTGGTSILNDIGSSKHHRYTIRGASDVPIAADKISEQTCKDSRLKCDVDMYMESRSSICSTCMGVCSSVTVNQSDSCHKNCPYIRLPPKAAAVMSPQEQDDSNAISAETNSDQTATATIVVGSALGVIVIIIVIFGIQKVCLHGNRPRRNPQNEEGRHGDIKMTRLDTAHSNVTTEGIQECGQINENEVEEAASHRESLLDTNNSDGVTISFRELDINAHFFDGRFKSIH